MKNTKIIYETKPKVSLTGILILFFIGAVFIYISDTLTLRLFMGGIFAAMLILIMIRNFYANGMIITSNYIELIRKNLSGKIMSEKINFQEVKKIGWSDGRVKWDNRAIYLDTQTKRRVKVLIDKGPFEFGHVLKFLSEKGINIELFHSDQELRLFIDGKITEFPMSNEKTT